MQEEEQWTGHPVCHASDSTLSWLWLRGARMRDKHYCNKHYNTQLLLCTSITLQVARPPCARGSAPREAEAQPRWGLDAWGFQGRRNVAGAGKERELGALCILLT